MKYNKGSLESAVDVAQKLHTKTGQPYYIFATGIGYKVDTQKPPFRQRYSVVPKEGR